MRCTLVLLLFHFSTVLGQKCCKEAETDGSGDFTHHSQSLNTTHNITFCVWVKPAHPDNYYIVNYRDPSDATQILITTRQVWIMTELALNLSFPVNESSYVCIAWGSADGVYVYINGTPVANNTADNFKNNPINFTGRWYIGNEVSSVSKSDVVDVSVPASSTGFVGSLCGMTIWSDFLSLRYISELYTNQTFSEQSEENEDISTTESEYAIIREPQVTWAEFELLNYKNIDDTFCENDDAHGIRLGGLDPVASKFVILFLVIIGVIIGFGALFMCSEREIANKRANKRLKQENNVSIDNVSSHSVT